MILTARLMVDVLIGRNLGLDLQLEKVCVCILFPLVVAPLGLVVRLYCHAWRLLPVVLMIVLNYAITIPVRSWVMYPDLVEWTRYQLLPQLGLSLLIIGVLDVLVPRFLKKGRMQLADATLIFGVGVVLTLLHYRLVP